MNIKTEAYYICYRRYKKDQDNFLFENKEKLSEFIRIKNPLFYWCADPFPFSYEGKDYIFAERASYITRKGKIVCICLNDKKPKWKKVFSPKFHVSFPNVYKCDGNIYAVPETVEDKCVSRYLLDNNFVWSKESTVIMEENCVDTAFETTKWNYLFVYKLENNQINRFLEIRNFNDPSEKFYILNDSQKIYRPAGNAFYHKGKLILPTQNCSKRYGGGLLFNTISFQNETCLINRFETIGSEDITLFLKQKNAVGCHTYNFNENIEVIDVVFEKVSFLGFLQKLSRKISKVFIKGDKKQ